MKKICVFFAILACALLGGAVEGQTITANSCSASSVQAALNSVAVDGTTVVIPAGSCTWTTAVTYNQVYSTVVQGQTTCNGTPGVTTTSCTDNTIITDNINRSGYDQPDIAITTASGKSFRMTGLTFAQINGTGNALTYQGVLTISGSSQAVRIDHIHFNNINQTVMSWDAAYGVIDHVYAQLLSEFLRPTIAGDGWGDASFAAPTNFGTNQFVFLEDSTMTMDTPTQGGNGTTDCFSGGKVVVRHNTLNYSSVGEHGTGHAGEDRGCRAAEVYQNNFTLANDTNNYWQYNAVFMAAGTAMIWGNTFPTTGGNYYNMIASGHINREDSATYTQSPTPSGWGYCGTEVNGIGSNWDQNTNTSTGFACLDQPGRGQGDLLSGSGFPNRTNSATGTISWPRQKLEPVYEWSDTWNCTASATCAVWNNSDLGLKQNQDYYLGSNGNANCPASPTGTCSTGVGVGTLANRPPNCIANPIAYPPGNSPGVAYWATDQGNWNQSGTGGQGVLYVCTAANAWTPYYTPYTYPHPLNQNTTAPPTGPAPAPATALQATVH